LVGGEFIQPSSNNNNNNNNNPSSGKKGPPATTYITILWIVLVSLLLMTTVLSLVLLFVCRHNSRNTETYTFTHPLGSHSILLNSFSVRPLPNLSY
ncbi:unnamed protein product, partial [Candidula unifasciata]